MRFGLSVEEYEKTFEDKSEEYFLHLNILHIILNK